ncbi:nucleoside deaminase [Streptomyces sp. NPDC051658]|uniref:nucleoside deaminase n=1 Tax=Streptomyces sp. NPDC051658 TaxID=3365667 RepID=UPI0037ACAFF5
MGAVNESQAVTEGDREYLRRCVDLAREALTVGDEPFGSLLVDERGTVRFHDRNRVKGGDATRHPEFEIARWAAENLSPQERRTSVVYTSGEHCPMCSAAHAWVGLGRIVYASSAEQLVVWRRSWGFDAGPVAALPIHAVAPGIPVSGPDPSLVDEVRALHARMLGVAADG